jgi:hypothetical protein
VPVDSGPIMDEITAVAAGYQLGHFCSLRALEFQVPVPGASPLLIGSYAAAADFDIQARHAHELECRGREPDPVV